MTLEQITLIRSRAVAVWEDIEVLLQAHTGQGKYDPKNAAIIDALSDARWAASNCRLFLHDAQKAAVARDHNAT